MVEAQDLRLESVDEKVDVVLVGRPRRTIPVVGEKPLGGRAVPTLWCVRCWFWVQNTKICHLGVSVSQKRLKRETPG
jgi:hypothetical protein